jgi:uncharacterized protein YggU (UPF0235/DUF167 family)
MQIKVLAKPNSKEEKVEKIDSDTYKIWTKEEAKDNKANFDILRIISEYFKVPMFCIKLISGRKSKLKVFKIENEK